MYSIHQSRGDSYRVQHVRVRQSTSRARATPPLPDPSSLPSLEEINKGLEAFSAAGTASADVAAQVGMAIDQAGSSGAPTGALLAIGLGAAGMGLGAPQLGNYASSLTLLHQNIFEQNDLRYLYG
jgi:hypothetical protein